MVLRRLSYDGGGGGGGLHRAFSTIPVNTLYCIDHVLYSPVYFGHSFYRYDTVRSTSSERTHAHMQTTTN